MRVHSLVMHKLAWLTAGLSLLVSCGDSTDTNTVQPLPTSASEDVEISSLEANTDTYLKVKIESSSALKNPTEKCLIRKGKTLRFVVGVTDGYHTRVTLLDTDKQGCAFSEGWVWWTHFTVTNVQQATNAGKNVENFEVDTRINVCGIKTGINFHESPARESKVLMVIDNGLVGRVIARSGDWYQTTIYNTTGWLDGRFLCAAQPTQVSRNEIISSSQDFLGYAYWWGGAKLVAGPHSTRKCFDAQIDTYGADCSGYVGKVWQLPEFMPFEENKHPYSTRDFYQNHEMWNRIERASLKKGDALVRRNESGGHIAIYESHTAWNFVVPYEARGCDYGITHEARIFGAEYLAIRLKTLIDP